MKPIHDGYEVGRVSRRSMIAGTVASGVVVAGGSAALAQGTPVASPVSDASIDLDRIMTLSEGLCGGARLNADKVEGLMALLRGESDVLSTIDELEAIEEITDEAIAAASPEAQELASNILQYWFLGRWDGEPVENRAEMYFDLASWQTLPYSTQQSTCKSFGYWAVEIEL